MSLRFAILGLLATEELSGYEITRRFASSVGYFWHARSQQIYPELARLEKDALILGRQVEQRGRPDKRVYAMTPQGRRELEQWAVTPSPPTLVKDEFLVKVWCYGMLNPAASAGALAEHRAQHRERLEAFREIQRSFGSGAPAELPAELMGAYLTLSCGIAMEEAFGAWCEEAESILRVRGARD